MSVPAVSQVEELIALIEVFRRDRDPSRRILVAIAGPPGVGKSTLADRIQQGLATSETVPMGWLECLVAADCTGRRACSHSGIRS